MTVVFEIPFTSATEKYDSQGAIAMQGFGHMSPWLNFNQQAFLDVHKTLVETFVLKMEIPIMSLSPGQLLGMPNIWDKYMINIF